MLKAVLYIPKERHGDLIGKGGSTMAQLTALGVSVDVPKREQSSNVVTVSGAAAAVNAACAAIGKLLGFAASTTPLTRVQFAVPEQHVGRLIGSGGSMLREIQASHNVMLALPKGTGSGILEGPPDGVKSALAKIEQLLGAKVAITSGAVEAQERPQIEALVPKKDLRQVRNDVLFFPDASGATFQQFMAHLEGATRSIDVCVFTISDDRISHYLIAASKALKVRVITDAATASNKGSDIESMCRAGVEVRTNTAGLMHHKYVVLDGIVVLNGSFNWTSTAASQNAENIMVSNDATFVQHFSHHFEKMWGDYSANVFRPGMAPVVSREIAFN